MFAVVPSKLTALTKHPRYQAFSLLPAALRDLALVVDAGRHAEEVRRTLLNISRPLAGPGFALEAVELFDLYQGKALPEGKKSLAFSLSFRSSERTLTDDEVNATFTRIQQQIVADGSIAVRT
jgi:phenylalanyl-tRNA synthetase beta chain